MGFFSWDCKRCGHALLSPYVTNEVNAWMKNTVILFENGSRLIGEYDGYGRVNDDVDVHDCGDNPCAFHYDCWVFTDKPEYSTPSASSEDQGFFFEEGAHDLPSPILPGTQTVEKAKPVLSNSLFSYDSARGPTGGDEGESGSEDVGVFENITILQDLQCTDSFVIPSDSKYNKAVIRPYYSENAQGFQIEIVFHGSFYTHSVNLKTDLFGECSWINGFIS